MSKRKLLFLLSSIGLLGFIVSVSLVNSVVAEPPIAGSSSINRPDVIRPLSLLEVWHILEIRAEAWRSGSSIASISSFSLPEDSALSGQDGKRRGWDAVLLSKNQEDPQLEIRLIDGEITQETEYPANPDLQAVVKPKIDSPDSLVIAKQDRPLLDPSTNEQMGYNFMIQGNRSDPSTLNVAGLYKTQPAFVGLNPATGELTLSQVLAFGESGGVIYSKDAGKTWQASNLANKLVRSIYPDPSHSGQGYAIIVEAFSLALYQTADGGQTWSFVNALPQQAGTWSFSLAAVRDEADRLQLLVGTQSGLWISTNGKEWQRSSLPLGPGQWLATIQSGSRYRVLLTISAGEDKGLYSSTNLREWTQISENVFRLSESYDKEAVIATDETQPNASMLLTLDTENSSGVSGNVLRVAGDFKNLETALYDDATLGIGTFENGGFQPTLKIIGGTLAASPDYSASHIAIVGGFRSGIYRTEDHGQSWEVVVLDPSQLLSGSNEIFDVRFMSSNLVSAINGGTQTWQDF